MAWAKGNVNIGGISGNKTVSAATLADSGYYKVAYMSIPGCIKTDSIKVIVKPLPILSGISTNSPICSGNTLTFGLNASPGSTYSWSGPNSFTSVLEDPNISSAATNASGTYSVTVSLNGCSVNTTVVNVVNLTPTVSTTSPVAICQGAALTLNVNNTPTATYGWSGPSGFSSIIEDPLVSNTATVGMNGTYSVTVSLGSCSANGTIAVTVNPNPVLLITNQNTTGSGPVNITVPAATAGSTLPPSSSLSYFTNSLATNVLASPTEVAISGTYYIKATSPAGCVDVKPIVVNICGSTFNLVSPTDDYNSELQVKTSTVKITASNKITGTANITYRSAQAIELNPGFLAANGTVFLAEKGICN
jgi:predicted secreted protein